MNKNRKLVIFGATGKVGNLLVKYALDDGYEVVAFVHHTNNLRKNARLSIVEGDVYNPKDVQNAMKDADVIISALGSWGTRRKDVLASAMTNIIPAMRKTNTTRIISLTGAEARAKGDDLGLVHKLAHFFINILAGKVLRDGEKHIALLEKSQLDWTVIRSPIMSSGTNEIYSLSHDRPFPWHTINRSAVARAILNQIEDANSQTALFVR